MSGRNLVGACLLTGIWLALAADVGAADFGDVDYNGATDAVDVQLIINAALGLEVLVQHTDLDYDEVTNAVDVQLVINAALGIVTWRDAIQPSAGQPGAKVTITGSGFDPEKALENNRVFFGDTAMLVIAASEHVLTTSAPFANPGAVSVRVEVNGAVAVEGLDFEILTPPTPPGDPGTKSSSVQNDIASIVADTGYLMGEYLQTVSPENADDLDGAFAIVNLQLDTLSNMLEDPGIDDGAREALDEVLMASGLADALGAIQKDLKAQRLKIMALKEELASSPLKYGGLPGVPESAVVPQLRFTLDWTAARLHHAMEYANVAMMGLSAAGAAAGGVFTVATGMAGVVAATLNNIYTIIELAPMQLKEGTLTGRVGETGNTIATNSVGWVVFEGTFEPESSLDGALLGAFLPGFVSQLGLGPVIENFLTMFAADLLNQLQMGDQVRAIFSEENVPIFTYDFVGDPPTEPNPPTFNGGGYATLDVGASVIVTEGTEVDGLLLHAQQRVYEFKGNFWKPDDRPRVEIRTEECSVTVNIQHGYRIEFTGPEDGASVDTNTITVEGQVTNWDGSPLGKQEITVVIVSGGVETAVTLDAEGNFSQEAALTTGENQVSVVVADGSVTSTSSITVWSSAFPTTYCVVTNATSADLSIIDPTTAQEAYRTEAPVPADNRYRDAVFVGDDETVMVVDSRRDPYETFVTGFRLRGVNDVAQVVDPIALGDGFCEHIALLPDGETLLVPLHYWVGSDTVDSLLFTLDVRNPLTPRIADVVEIIPDDLNADYGPRDVAAGLAGDGETTIALVTTGDFQDGGPSELVLVEVTNPYAPLQVGGVEVGSRGGSVAVVPGASLAVVTGISFFGSSYATIDSTINVVDFSDPAVPEIVFSVTRPGSFMLGVATAPDGSFALLTDAVQGGGISNSALLLDLSDHDNIALMGVPFSFGGQGSQRAVISSDGAWAVVANANTSTVVVLDLSDLESLSASAPIAVGSWPLGVVFRP